MKKWVFFLGCCCLLVPKLWANVEVSVSHACFKSAEGSYAEFQIYFIGRSVKWELLDTVLSQAAVEVSVAFKQKDQIVKFDKYIMRSPKSAEPVNFFDLKRYALDNGGYDVELSFKDVNRPDNAITYRTSMVLDYTENALRQSDIMLLSVVRADSSNSPLVKNGIYMEAQPFAFFDDDHSVLSFYNEIYNADKFIGDDFLFSYAIVKAFAPPSEKPVLIGHKKKKPTGFIANLVQLDIKNLESGNYRLVLSIRNRQNDLLSEKEMFFQRSNNALVNIPLDTITSDALMQEFVGPMTDIELRYALRAIAMKVPEGDAVVLNLVLQNKDLMAQRRFLYNYWLGQSPRLPEQAFDEYMLMARQVDKKYANGFGYGFESDRGRVYMKYGRPDDIISVENEMNAPPYEIWVYNRIEKNQQSNVKFLFYNPNLIANGYRLLHSTCRGEIANPRWVRELYKNVPTELIGNNVDNNDVGQNFNRRAVQLFNDN